MPLGTPSRLITGLTSRACLRISISLTGAALSAGDVTCLVMMVRISLHTMRSPPGGLMVTPARSTQTSPMVTGSPDS